MARLMRSGIKPFYVAAERFVTEALRSDGSLFTPGASVWSASNIGELYHLFVEQSDTGSDNFEVKLRRQLGGAPAKGYTAGRRSALCPPPDCKSKDYRGCNQAARNQ